VHLVKLLTLGVTWSLQLRCDSTFTRRITFSAETRGRMAMANEMLNSIANQLHSASPEAMASAQYAEQLHESPLQSKVEDSSAAV
jgi:hypothetical protein